MTMLYQARTTTTAMLALLWSIAALFLSGCDEGTRGDNVKMADTASRSPAGEERVMLVDEDSADAAWMQFWEEFRAAVRQRDSAAIRGMMGGRFGYGNTLEATPEFVFQELAYGGGENWNILDRTLALGSKPYDLPSSNLPARVAINPNPCGGTPCRYQAWAMFEKGTDERWRWIAFIFPGD